MLENEKNEVEKNETEQIENREEAVEQENEIPIPEIQIPEEEISEDPIPETPVQDIPVQETPMTKRQKKHMHAFVKALCCGIIFGVVAGGIIMGSTVISKKVITPTVSIETNASKLAQTDASGAGSSTSAGNEYTVSQIAAQCKSSVVAITNQSVSEVRSMFGVMQQQNESSGSGVIIGKNDTELLIVTNNHVVEGSQSLTVCFNDSKDAVFNAQIKGTDSENDLAVIAIKLSDINEDTLSSISVATVGDSTKLEVGDGVVAIGNALGFGQSVTSGIVSALDREVTIDNTTATLLQTDAAINPGNSGGALFNMKGELIGINTAKYASETIEGMGFAIPMAKAEAVIDELKTQETREKLDKDYGYLNIAGGDVDETAVEMYGIPSGVYVSEVYDGGAAAKAGIKQGDIITAIGGKKVSGIQELKSQLQYFKAGEKVEVVIQRNSDGGYKEKTLEVTLDNASDHQTTQDSQSQGSQRGEADQDTWGSDGYQTIPYSEDPNGSLFQ